MQVKTINKIISNKVESWLGSITDVGLRNNVKQNLVVSGGCITSLFQGLPVNDFDIYIQDMDVLYSLARYYCGDKVLDGRLRDLYLGSIQSRYELDENNSMIAVRYRTLKEDQIKLNVFSAGVKNENLKKDDEGNIKNFQVAFLSQKCYFSNRRCSDSSEV